MRIFLISEMFGESFFGTNEYVLLNYNIIRMTMLLRMRYPKSIAHMGPS